MRVYVNRITPRVQYAIQLLIRHALNGVGVKVVDNWEAFESYEGPKFIYGREQLDGVLNIYNAELLFESDIAEQDIHVSKDEEGIPFFFPTSSQSSIPFDVFAAAFYLVSRYEEYLPHRRDHHDRYMPEESLAYQHGFLQIPVVNHWALRLKDVLLASDPRWELPGTTYSFKSTVDVDNLYAYKGKEGFRTIGGFAKDFAQFNLVNAFRRFKAITGLMQDPYDTFAFQRELMTEYGVEAIYFILFAEFGEFDRNLPMYSRRLHESVRAINDFVSVGIHPSYGSHRNPRVIEKEIRGLEEALRYPVTRSRQHFLKMQMPGTFRQLVDFGIKEDYTMGYASELGFRASICTPYPFYDLELEVQLDLMMHPFAMMDGTLIYYQEITASDALERLLPIVDAVKAVDGQLISVWHNRIFSEYEPEWRGWNKVFSELLKYATS